MAKIKDISKTPVLLRSDLAAIIQEEYGAEIEEHGLTYVAHVILIGYFNRRRAQMKLPPLPPAQTRSQRLSESATRRWEKYEEAAANAEREAETKKGARRKRDRARKAKQSATTAESGD